MNAGYCKSKRNISKKNIIKDKMVEGVKSVYENYKSRTSDASFLAAFLA